jgi:hypothetical protein
LEGAAVRFAVESGGTIAPDHHEPFEADVAVNLGTGEVDFFIVVESAGPEDASGIDEPVWDEVHRRADPVPA